MTLPRQSLVSGLFRDREHPLGELDATVDLPGVVGEGRQRIKGKAQPTRAARGFTEQPRPLEGPSDLGVCEAPGSHERIPERELERNLAHVSSLALRLCGDEREGALEVPDCLLARGTGLGLLGRLLVGGDRVVAAPGGLRVPREQLRLGGRVRREHVGDLACARSSR